MWGEPCGKWGIELLCMCNSYVCLCRSASTCVQLCICRQVDYQSMNKPVWLSSVVNKMVSPLSQVFLQLLPSLSQLQNFPELWLGILDFMEKVLHLDNSDLLVSLIPRPL